MNKLFIITSLLFTLIGKTQIDTPIVFLANGLQDFESQDAFSAVYDDWNVHYSIVGGCMVGKTLGDSIKTHNEKMELIAERKLGKGWRDKMAAEIKKELSDQKLAKELANELDYVKRTLHYKNKRQEYPRYKVIPIERGKLYELKLQMGVVKEGVGYKAVYHYLKVNIATKEIQNLSEKTFLESYN